MARRSIVPAVALAACAMAPAVRAQECRVLNVPLMEPKGEAEREWIGDRHGHHRARAGIAWFGAFTRNANYAEIRAILDEDGLDLHVMVADLFVWWIMQDGIQWGGTVVAELDEWDAVEIVLDPVGSGPDPHGTLPTAGALRMLAANYPYNDPVGYPETALPHRCTRTFRGAGGTWERAEDPEAEGIVWYHAHGSSWNEDPGPSNNTTEFDNGTDYQFFVPWSSLGLDAAPPSGATMRMAVIVHDVDDPRDGDVSGMAPPPSERGSAQVGPLPDRSWPEGADPEDASTWGTIVLHQAPYVPVEVAGTDVVTIFAEDVAEMRDVTVGGHSFIEDRWTEGGGDPAEYRWDNCMDTRFGTRSDLFVHPEGHPTHMCFFDRTLLFWDLAGVVPSGHVVTHAELVMHHFGGDANEDPGTPGFDVLTSPVQVHRLEGSWTDLPIEECVTWNTAPLAAENAGYGEITPIPSSGDRRDVTFDVTPLVARAVIRGEPLDIALYGADTTANTGKYLVSNEGGWEPENRPHLVIEHGEPVDPSRVPDGSGCTLGVAEGLFTTPGTGTPEQPEPLPELPDEPLPEPAPDAGDASGPGAGCGCTIVGS
jgi:hypothetical protein